MVDAGLGIEDYLVPEARTRFDDGARMDLQPLAQLRFGRDPSRGVDQIDRF